MITHTSFAALEFNQMVYDPGQNEFVEDDDGKYGYIDYDGCISAVSMFNQRRLPVEEEVETCGKGS